MTTYETILIFKPTFADPEVTGFSEKVKTLITGGGGEIVGHEVWGRRKFSYPISKFREGTYAYFKHKSAPGTVKKLDQTLLLSENLLRYMTVRLWERAPRPERIKKTEKSEVKERSAAPAAGL